LVVLLVAAGLAGLLVLNTSVNSNSFRLHEQAKRGKQLDVTEAQLRRDVANLDTPSRLDSEARRLGLVPAGTPGFIDLRTGTVNGKPQPAGAGGNGGRR
jgi:type II secretory pathway component PulJ